ncbi:MAG: fatty acid--CoA ligase family protein [Desulfovibrio sp.]|nr:fatty acid--CoA ligase family protein [Desulfovibrio sp.]
MRLLQTLIHRVSAPERPFLAGNGHSLSLSAVAQAGIDCQDIAPGEVVALIGDFDAQSIAALLALIDRGAVIMPLTEASATQHEYFLEAGHADWLIHNGKKTRLRQGLPEQPLLQNLRERGHAGLILFSSGSTGRPKAILHDFSRFLARYDTPRPAWITLNFLLFDHIGGLNTLFHTLYNNGLVIRPSGRTPAAVVDDIQRHNIQLLPTTPTFLRLWALEGMPAPSEIPSLRLITYGTERMDQHTLSLLAEALPGVNIRQTYGMSELGILRIRTRSRDGLWMEVGGEGVESKVIDGELYLRARNRMEGYLNAASPFDDEGWYATRDIVECDGPWLRIVGRRDTLINVGGLKVLPSEVEHAALQFPGICLARVEGRSNPVTGMHVELLCQPEKDVSIDKKALLRHLRTLLPPHAVPARLVLGQVPVGHRYKQL